MNRTRYLHALVFALLVGHAAALAVGGSADALRVVAGLAILHLVPGVYIAALVLKETRLGPFALATVGINYACVIVLSTAIKLCGQVVTPWSYLAAAALASAALAALVQARRARLARVQLPGRGLWLTIAAGPAIVGYVFLAHPTIPWSPDDFLTPDFHWRLAKLRLPGPLIVRLPKSNPYEVPRVFYHGSAPQSGRWAHVLRARTAKIDVYGGRLVWLAHATRECLLTFERQGKLLTAYYFHAPFNIERHPPNYPPNTQLIDLRLPDAGGSTEVRVTVKSSYADCKLQFHDLTDMARRALGPYVRSRFAIWDIGDVREQLSLARNLRDHLLPFTYSYDGTIFDGGGYTITHLPLRSYVGMAAFVLLGDRMASFLFVWLVQLWIIFAITCGLARVRGPWQTLCALLPVLAYATLVRPNIEGACLRTTSIVVLLGFAYFLLSEDRGNRARLALLILFAALCCLTKVGLMALPVLLFAHVFSTRAKGRRLLTALGLTAGGIVAVGLAAFAIGKATGVWDEWWRTLLGGSFAGKFSIVLTLLADVPASGEFVRLGARPWAAFLRAVCDYTWWTAIGSCLLPAAVVLKRDRVAGCLLFAGGVVYLICAASDPTLIIPNTYCSHYFTRVAGVVNLLAAGGLRCLCLANVRRRWLAVWIAVGALMLPLAKYEHHRQDKALEAHPWHGAMYKAAVIDFLKREAIRDLGRGRIALARNTCHKMMLVDRTYLPTALLLANCDQAEGKWQAAAKRYEQGLARPWELDDAGEFARNALNAAQCYLRLGNRGRAQYWLGKAAATEGFDRMGLQDQAAAIRGALRVRTQGGTRH